MKPIKVIRYFYPESFIKNTWSKSPGSKSAEDLLIRFHKKHGCVLHLNPVNSKEFELKGIFCPAKTDRKQSDPVHDFFSVAGKDTSFLGIPSTVHTIKSPRAGSKIESFLNSEIQPVYHAWSSLALSIQELSTSESICILQFFVHRDQAVPIVCVLDTMDVAEKGETPFLPLFETPVGWHEVPRGVFEDIVNLDLKDAARGIIQRKGLKQYRPDWVVLENLSRMSKEFAKEGKNWPEYKRTGYKNQIDTLVDFAERLGLDVSKVLDRIKEQK